MDGVFKLFNALTRIKKRLDLSNAYIALEKFTKRKITTKKKDRNYTILLTEDKENLNPWQETLANLKTHKSRSKDHHPLILNKNTSTTFSFNNTANQEDTIGPQQNNYQSH
jgi:hypothetical protein